MKLTNRKSGQACNLMTVILGLREVTEIHPQNSIHGDVLIECTESAVNLLTNLLRFPGMKWA